MARPTHDQNLNLQRDALTQAGCDRIFEDTTSGARAERPGLDRMKEQLRSGDTLVVWRLDRLGRTLRNLIEWVTWLESEGIAFKSLQESIDTTGSPRLLPEENSSSICLEHWQSLNGT